MVVINREDGGEPILLLASDSATLDISTWCSDPEGQKPEQVHLIFEPIPGTRLMCRFTGPETLSRLIDALILHRGDVWPDYKGN